MSLSCLLREGKEIGQMLVVEQLTPGCMLGHWVHGGDSVLKGLLLTLPSTVLLCMEVSRGQRNKALLAPHAQ